MELGLVLRLVYNTYMNLIKKNYYKLFLVTSAIILPIISFAQTDPPCDPAGGKICNPLNSTSTLQDLIKNVLEKALYIGVPIIALAIIYSGFLFVSAVGNPEKIGKAKDTLLYTLIGAAILLGSWAIAQLITSTVTAL